MYLAIDPSSGGPRVWLTAKPGATSVWREGAAFKQKPTRKGFESSGVGYVNMRTYDMGGAGLEVSWVSVGIFASSDDLDDFATAFLTNIPAYGTMIKMRQRTGVTPPTWAVWTCPKCRLLCDQIPQDKGVALILQYTAKVPVWTAQADYIPSAVGDVAMDSSGAVPMDASGAVPTS